MSGSNETTTAITAVQIGPFGDTSEADSDPVNVRRIPAFRARLDPDAQNLMFGAQMF
jgi:hypothetical protein